MKHITFFLLIALFAGCEHKQLAREQKERMKITRAPIWCFTPKGWVEYYTYDGDPFFKGGWSFYNLAGVKVRSSICHQEKKLTIK
jgi:hypothetical protein